MEVIRGALKFGKRGRRIPGGREKPLHLQSTSDLWVAIIAVPGFGGLLLAAPLMGTPLDGSRWSTFWVVLLCGGFFTLAGVLVGTPRLKELRQRGELAPPGVARKPVLVSIVLSLLIRAAGVTVQFALARIVRVFWPVS